MEWKCSACSATNPDGTRFCGHCGRARMGSESGGLSTADITQTVAEVATLLETAEGSPEERRLVTVLFADIAGFTALADRLDPELLVEVIDPVLAAMSNVITSYGGHVSKYAGDALLAFFGAPQAHEDDAVRALLAAREMSAAVERLAPNLRETGPLSLHIGVNTGHVVTGFRGGEVRLDYSVLGDAVNVAQRLEAAGAAGEIYVGELTYLLGRESFRFEEVGELTLKGKPDPVRAWRLVAESEADAARATGSLVGRERERALIGKLVAAVAGGEARLLALVGEPGVGKSRLLEALRGDAEAAGMRWSQVKCRSYGTGAYGPYLELIRSLAGIKPEDPPELAAARIAESAQEAGTASATPYLQHVLGIVDRDAIPERVLNSPETLRHRVHEALVDFLTVRAAQSPLVIAIEDAHWMDSASIELSLLLAERAARLPVLAAITARAEGREVVERVAAAFGKRAALVDLQQLDRAAIANLVRDIVGEPDEQLLDLVASRTSGNPLFVQEVVRSLMDTNALVQRGSGWHVEEIAEAENVPTTVESVLAARIDLLPRDATELLQIASVIGAEIRPALLQDVAEAEPLALGRLVGVLVERELLERGEERGEPRLLFHHALVVDVAYGRLLRRRRREIHRRVVETAIRLYGSGDDVVDLLAHHAYRGEMGAEAVSYLERAGRRAAQLYANDEAISHLRRALEIAEKEQLPDAAIAKIILELAGLEHHTGAYESSLHLYERARALTNDLASEIGVATSLGMLGRHEEAMQVLEAARAAHPAPTPIEATTLALEQGRLLVAFGEFGSAKTMLETGLASAEGRDARIESQLLLQLAHITQYSEQRIDEAVAYAERARRLSEESEDLAQLARTLRALGGFQCDAAEDDPEGLKRACETLEQAGVLARRVGNAEEQGASLVNLGRALGLRGESEAALEVTRESLAAFESVGNKSGVACAYCNLCDYFSDLERWEECLEVAQLALGVAEEIATPFWITGALLSISVATQALGDSERAAAAAERALELALVHGLHDRTRHAFEHALAAYESLGNTDRLRELQNHATALAQR